MTDIGKKYALQKKDEASEKMVLQIWTLNPSQNQQAQKLSSSKLSIQ